jgi:thiol:disulfide interchange protein
VDFIEVIKETVILVLVLFPVWLPALLGRKWPTLSKAFGWLMFAFAAVYPLSVLLMDASRSEANAWLLSAAAALVGVAHITLRSSGMPAATTELRRKDSFG